MFGYNKQVFPLEMDFRKKKRKKEKVGEKRL